VLLCFLGGLQAPHTYTMRPLALEGIRSDIPTVGVYGPQILAEKEVLPSAKGLWGCVYDQGPRNVWMVYPMTTLQVQKRSVTLHNVCCALTVCFLSGTMLWGCATFNPQPLNEHLFRKQAVSQTKNGLRVSAAVLGSTETETVFSLQLYKKGIQPVWVGQISRIIRRAVWDKFTIEPDVDEARYYLLQDLWYAQGLLRYGYIRISDMATLSDPRNSLQDDDYFTDGLCLVMWVSNEPVSFAEVQFEPWERPIVERKKRMLGP
jgi:hypothetical protein